ncbi:RHS repeat-associated core domain-containing protein [Chryseobacterium sp. MYb264]|uniref:RHS repeat domain-containing protein n=1 Tax=Chryseobacterium sp. MYb264 TaxID=2745153 RepID=UPI002E11045C|nr:RHS repeat-associated core domain-containing protein [Chryseobacterium sp. MYb264]
MGGNSTNKTLSYSYDNLGRVVSRSGTSNGKSYGSNVVYDSQGRILSSSENSNGKYFIQKGTAYDDKARIISYEKQLYSAGTLTKVQIENLYSPWNGELYQVKDKNSGKILWELKETDAKGAVLKAKLGATEINNIYDTNGYLTNVNHSSQVKPSILQLSYSFDAIKNELKSRTTGGDFNIVESFDYDDNNRLINWTNPVTGIKPSGNRNIYDIKGRIIQNDQVGTMKYENSSKIYQPTGMTLNTVGTQNYNNDLIQSIVYNENNDPVFIDGEKGDVAFQYGLTSMRQRVTYGGNFSTDGEGKFTKFYSEDGSFEVVKDNTTGQEKHIIYIGGTPYESNIVYLKSFNENNGSYKFLHKDYLGTLLAISDEAGNKLEQRHFDAWGNFTHLQIGNGAIITDKDVMLSLSKDLIIDRGYTSHEHFGEVGIIHMNGRLYDPLLRRFLSADENIQDPFNTQIYNKYGYVMNNPLIYADPNGEFVWIIVGAVIGAYVTGVKANNGSWDPTKWNWKGTWTQIAAGAAIGAISGGIAAEAGAAALAASNVTGGFLGGVIAGGVGGAAGGAVSGAMTAGLFGENIAEGALMGATTGLISGAILGGAAGAVKQISTNIKASDISAKGNIWTGNSIAEGRSPWAFNNSPKTTTVGTTPKVSSSGKVGVLNVEKMDGEIQIGTSLEGEQAGASIYKADQNLAKIPQEEILVRHHTSYKNLKLIKKSGFLNPSRGEPFGVDVEVAPFVNASKADFGQFNKGSYIEFYAPKSQLGVPPTYLKGGNGNVGRIYTEGLKPFDLKGTDPKFVRWNWLGF